MFCPKCGKINPDDAQLCSGCNAPLKEEVSSPAAAKKRSGLKLALFLIAAVVILVIVLYVLNGCSPLERPDWDMSF